MRHPPLPASRLKTIRHDIIAAITVYELTAKEISQEVGIPEKLVYDHLEHIRKSLKSTLRVRPAGCRKCGFTFRKRHRLSKPSRCPICRGEHISAPGFSVEPSERAPDPDTS